MKYRKRAVRSVLLLALVSVMLLAGRTFAADQTVKLGKLASGTKTNTTKAKESGYLYYDFTVSSPGMLEFSGLTRYETKTYTGNWLSMAVQLTNAKGKSIDRYTANYINANKKTFVRYGVKAGRYRLRVSAAKDNVYILGYAFSPVREKGTTKKAKAVKLKKGKTYHTFISAGSSAGARKWFKFKSAGKKKSVFYIKVSGQGQFLFEVRGAGRPIKEYVNANEEGTLSFFRTLDSKKMPLKAGTYYMRISKAYKGTNGTVSIKRTR